MKNSDLLNIIFEQGTNEDLKKSEFFLIKSIQKEKNELVLQELILLKLICIIKQIDIETQESKALFDELVLMTKKTEKSLLDNYKKDNSKGAKIILDVYYETNLHRLVVLENLYKNLNAVEKRNAIKVLRKELERHYLKTTGNYVGFVGLTTQKIFSNYGTSFRYLLTLTLLIVLFFGIAYYFIDYFSITRCISGVVLDGNLVNSINYYIYVALITTSNLGGDTGMACSFGNQLVFGVNQIIGVILFGILITLIGKKFD